MERTLEFVEKKLNSQASIYRRDKMFKKWREKRRQKKLVKQKQSQALEYRNWEKDLGFLHSLMESKKDSVKRFSLDVFNRQLGKGIIHDEDIAQVVELIVGEIIVSLSPMYQDFLIERYFRDQGELIKYVTEDVLMELSAYAINKNHEKIRFKTVSQMNQIGSSKKKQPKKEENKKED